MKEELAALVKRFEEGFQEFSKTTYNEAQLRIDFLNPLLRTFGWDVDNVAGRSAQFRNVLQEESIDVEEEGATAKKNPDYTLQIDGNRKAFLEAKKVSVDVLQSKAAAFQTRRYGWSASLGISILTNFEYLVVYDCRYQPDETEEAHVARYKHFHYADYLERFDELWEVLCFDQYSDGSIDEVFGKQVRDAVSFDRFFLGQLEKWRGILGNAALEGNPDLSSNDLNFWVQRLINRVVFLRICEDRQIETYEQLKSVTDYVSLKRLLTASDKKYNSGLFDFIEDEFNLPIESIEKGLIEFIQELYFPQSPYEFAIIEPHILAQIYESFLGNTLHIGVTGKLELVERDEIVASEGVVPSPKFLVDEIVATTLDRYFECNPDSDQFKIADVCCGSGSFLMSAFDHLVQREVNSVPAEQREKDDRFRILSDGRCLVKLWRKRELLENHLFGVDINPYAVDVAEFSLQLKLLENETSKSLIEYQTFSSRPVLPSLRENLKQGNSLVDYQYFEVFPDQEESDDVHNSVYPFQFEDEFGFDKSHPGFEVILGNPPYVRIQNMVKYSPLELAYYQHKESPYSAAKKDTIDKYYLFLERSLGLLKKGGVLGYVVPHKFFIAKGGRKLRKALVEKAQLHRIIHFGVQQAFPNRSTYVAILLFEKADPDQLVFERVEQVLSHRIKKADPLSYPSKSFGPDPWVFVSKGAQLVFDKMNRVKTLPLGEIAEIPVGLQTSKDEIYMEQDPKENEAGDILFSFEDEVWPVEAEICVPCIWDLPFKGFDTISANSKMLFPYRYAGGEVDLIPENELKTNFPKAYAYLSHHKSILSKRNLGKSKGTVWYQYGRSQSLTKFHEGKRLILQVLSKEPSYVLVEGNLQFTGGGNGPYYGIIRQGNYALEYLMGILSHPVVEAWVKIRASEFRGAYYSHGKQYISGVPIRTIDFEDANESSIYHKVIKGVKEVISLKDKVHKARNLSDRNSAQRRLSRKQASLIQSVNDLYGFTEEDIIATDENHLFSASISDEK